MKNSIPNPAACTGPGDTRLEGVVSQQEVPTVDLPKGSETTSPECLDEALGVQLELHLEALRSSGLPPMVQPELQDELAQLRPVVDQLHVLSRYVGMEAGEGVPTEDRRDRPPLQVATVSESERQRQVGPEGTPLSGVQIGKYQLVRKVGGGGQAGAYLAFDPDLRRHVVIKIYHEARTPREQEFILQEGRSLARVRSPYVAQCYSAERHEGVPYLVVEYIPGKNLAEVQRSKPLTLSQTMELIRQLAEGLAAVHACGLLHRDIKPANIIVGDDGFPRLVDFGLAAPLASESLRAISGTLAYMAPEQARGEIERIDPRSDLFGLGAVLYELLTGRPPYRADGQETLLGLAREGDVIPPRTLNPGLSTSVNDLCLSCLSKDPAQRFSSAGELVRAIRCWQRFSRWTKRKFTRLLLGGVGALVILVPLAVWYFARPGGTRDKRGKGDVLLSETDKSSTPAARDKTKSKKPRSTKEDDTARPAEKGKTVRLLLRHPHGRALRQDFPIELEVVDKKPDARGLYRIIAGDKIRFRFRLPYSAYVGVWHYDDAGNIVQLFPNPQLDRTHGVPRATWQEVPSDSGFAFQAEVSKRIEYLHLAACTRPWEPPTSGLRAGKNNSFVVLKKEELEIIFRGLTQVKVDKMAEVVLPFRVEPGE
jgi:serine/threonine protein kinase